MRRGRFQWNERNTVHDGEDFQTNGLPLTEFFFLIIEMRVFFGGGRFGSAQKKSIYEKYVQAEIPISCREIPRTALSALCKCRKSSTGEQN